MREQDWPDEARAAVITVLENEYRMSFDSVAGDVLDALAPHVTPTAPLRELADRWTQWSDIPARELREVIDRA